MKATTADGHLQILDKCRIFTPNGNINLRILPELTDAKGANYSNEPIIGRTTPIITYAYSEPRTIQSELAFQIMKCTDIADNLKYLRILQSCVYPGPSSGSVPYTPPPVCKFICGKLLGDSGVCVILKNISVRFPTEVAWEADALDPSYLPYRFTVSCSWEVVYPCSKLPTNNLIKESPAIGYWCPIPKV